MPESFKDLGLHYNFTQKDWSNLAQIKTLVLPEATRFAVDFYTYLSTFPEAVELFSTEMAIERRKESIAVWLERLFDGPFDDSYVWELRRVGETHVQRNIPIHWVTASMNYKRSYLMDVLERKVREKDRLHEYRISLDKILDLNLDIMISSYHEEELRQVFIGKRLDTFLIKFAERFTYGLNIILVMALIGISIGVIGMFIGEIYGLFTGSDPITGILSALGTLLIIWVMIELMSTEIKYLKGSRFEIEIFVSVALVAFIRELLIASLGEEAYFKLAILLAGILVLGVVYYLIALTSKRN